MNAVFVLFFGNVVLKIFYYPPPPPHLSLSIVESYTLTELSDVALPPDTPSTSISIDDLSPISPSNISLFPLDNHLPHPNAQSKPSRDGWAAQFEGLVWAEVAKVRAQRPFRAQKGHPICSSPSLTCSKPIEPNGEVQQTAPFLQISGMDIIYNILFKSCSQYDFFFLK